MSSLLEQESAASLPVACKHHIFLKMWMHKHKTAPTKSSAVYQLNDYKLEAKKLYRKEYTHTEQINCKKSNICIISLNIASLPKYPSKIGKNKDFPCLRVIHLLNSFSVQCP